MKRKSRRPTVGLVLSGGSVRGLSYIGLLKVFEEEKIPIDYVAGTSIGAVIGAFYCAGMHAKDMESLVSSVNWEDFMDFTCGYTGLIDGNKIEDFIRKNLAVKRFEDLYTPLATIAVDVNTGEEVVFEKGDVAEAVRASISIPGVFTPVKIGRHILVDGGIIDPVPIDVLKGKVDKIIAIDLSVPAEQYTHARAIDGRSVTWLQFKKKLLTQEMANLKDYLKKAHAFPRIFLRLLNPKYVLRFLKGKPLSALPMFETALKAHHLITNELIRMKLKEHKPDLLIRIDIRDARFIEFDKFASLIRKGEDVARRNLKAIKKLAKV